MMVASETVAMRPGRTPATNVIACLIINADAHPFQTDDLRPAPIKDQGLAREHLNEPDVL
jgi:hypothetical protein